MKKYYLRIKSLSSSLKLKSVSVYLIASIVSAIVGLLINPFLSIGLSHSDFALIGYYASISSILVPVIGFSLQAYYAKNYFQISATERMILLNTVLSLLLFFGFFILCIFIGLYYFYHINKISNIPFFPYALLSFVPIYFSTFYNLYLLELRMQDKVARYAIVSLSNVIAGALLSLLLVFFFRHGATGRLFALFFVSVLFGIYSVLIQKFRFSINWEIAKKAISFCSPLVISAVLTFFFMGIDRTLLVRLNDNQTLGLYNIGIQITGYLGIFSTVILQTFEPDLYKYVSLSYTTKVLKIVLIILFVTLVPNLLFILVSKPAIDLLTYGKYTDSYIFANILCLKNITTTLSFSLSTIVVAFGFSKIELLNKVLGAVLSLILYKILINNYGFLGAAWGQSISWLIMAIISITFLLIKRKNTNFIYK